MSEAVNLNLFTGYSIGAQNPTVLSHLQFADDTLLIGVKNWANVRALRAVLVLFENMSGLKVNYHKSSLFGINIEDSWLREAASILSCKVGRIPFIYLGLPIGGDPRRLAFWDPVIFRIKSRLSEWNSRSLSYGGRLILLKSVLSSLPVYALSFFRAPAGIISSIESILINFFWGGGEDNRKIAWVDWNSICMSKEVGGLGVRILKEFNIALLAKWCWRCLVDREGLWFKVLLSRYGEERGRLREGSRLGSAWWKEIVKIREGIGVEGGGWFEENISIRLGNGLNTYFWSDCWVGSVSFMERFRRLFELSIHQNLTVGAMQALGWGEDGEAWRWRRRLFAWEEDLVVEIRNLLSNISLQDSESDVWLWRPDPTVGYTVRGAYQMLMRQEIQVHDLASDAPWHKNVPLKVSICAWRLFRNRWPTKDNLVRRGVLSFDNQLCVSECGQQETLDHLIIHCNVFGNLWKLIKSWIGVYSVDPLQVTDHFNQFVHSSGGYVPRRSFLHLIWLCCIWVIWNERNQRLFSNKANTMEQLLEKVKLFSLRWLKAKNVSFPFGFHLWWQQPLACLGIG